MSGDIHQRPPILQIQTSDFHYSVIALATSSCILSDNILASKICVRLRPLNGVIVYPMSTVGVQTKPINHWIHNIPYSCTSSSYYFNCWILKLLLRYSTITILVPEQSLSRVVNRKTEPGCWNTNLVNWQRESSTRGFQVPQRSHSPNETVHVAWNV